MTVDVDALAAELVARCTPERRLVIGICGAPGAGKSTLAALLVVAVNRAAPGTAVVVGMDGFHLARSVIADDERSTRRGAPDTFDADGYAALLARIRTAKTTVYAPEYRREIEDPVNAAVAVPVAVRLVVTEGNYLLHPEWTAAREQLDEVWFLEAPDESLRVERLVERHVRFGKPPDRATEHVLRSDEANAALVASHRDLADRLLRWGVWS